MTYADLADWIHRMRPEQLNQTVTVYVNDMDEFYPVETCQLSDDSNDVLDLDHWFMVV